MSTQLLVLRRTVRASDSPGPTAPRTPLASDPPPPIAEIANSFLTDSPPLPLTPFDSNEPSPAAAPNPKSKIKIPKVPQKSRPKSKFKIPNPSKSYERYPPLR